MNRISIFIIIIVSSITLQAQDNTEYMFVMVKQKKALKMAQTEQDFKTLADNFERISNAETDQWHPLYYAALCYINMSLVSDVNANKDNSLDKAQVFIDKALLIYPDESELYALQGLLYQARIQVNKKERMFSYTEKAEEALETARDYNPENPRVYYLLGISMTRLPEEQGGGMTKACAYFETAREKFNVYHPDHVLSPTWGGERNEQFINQFCK